MSLYTNSHSSPAAIGFDASFSSAKLLGSVLTLVQSMTRSHQHIGMPKNMDMIRGTTRLLSRQIFKKVGIVRNMLTSHLS